jgi:hypothetical protein
MSDYLILVKYASRGRPDRFLQGLENIYAYCARPELIRVLVTADIDDKTMCNDEMRDIINAYQNCTVIYGTSDNKIHAINRDLDILPERFADWQILANFSDDMRWTMFGWDEYIRTDFKSIYPDLSGYIAYRDPDTMGSLSTLLIAGRKWIDNFGFIYNPVYQSLFADNEMEEIAKIKGKYHYTGYSIYQHFNPAYNYRDYPEDTMFREQQTIGWTVDQMTYIERKGKNFYL